MIYNNLLSLNSTNLVSMRRIFIWLVLLLSVPQLWAAVFVVDSNADTDDLLSYTVADGTNTLRKCIRLANANSGADLINFNLPGSTVITNSIGGGGAWFSITDPVVIQGYSQPGSVPGLPIIELNGNSLGRWFNIELTTGSAGSAIIGLIMYGTNIGLRLDPNTSANTISGCWIGVDNTGNVAAPNVITEHGIRCESSSNNTFGGSAGAISRNIIGSCGQEGIRFEGTSSNNTVNGNYIGIGNDGVTKLGNRSGVYALNATNLEIGGGAANEGNIISGNNARGIFLINSDAFTIQGNIIGLGADLTTVVDNNFPGIEAISGSDGGQIGGAGADERNYISGNTDNGIRVDDCNNLSVQGNYIGVAGDGTTPRPNAGTGVVGTNCEFMTVGGAAAGEGNVVSANGGHGISIWGADSRNAVIQGNTVGLSADGLTPLGNGAYGIEINENENSQIGGTTVASRNVVANNNFSGIGVLNSPNTVVEGNYIGVDATGNVDRGNNQHGITVINSANVTIGGTTRNSRNIISGNALNGISFEGTSSGGIVKANFIGIGADGTTPLKNDENGVRSIGECDNMTVGGPTLPERNVISANGQFTVGADPDNGFVGDGIRVLGTDNHLIQNNYIGTDSTGTIGLGNHWAGVSLNDDSDNSEILDNLISDNRNEGIWIYNGTDSNEFYRNIIGEASDGSPLGNWDFGVIMDVGASNSNIFGGSLANANTIAHTRGERPGEDGNGVTIAGAAGNNNEITFNNIHCNGGKGILRIGTSNESQPAPIILSSNTNDVNGTGDNGRIIHVYLNVSADGGLACDCEGEVYVGSTTVAGGTWSLVHGLGLTPAEAMSVSATQTTVTGSTSEFSTCSSPILPISYLYLKGQRRPRDILLEWATETEINNAYFNVQLSVDGEYFQDVGTVAGNGTTTVPHAYEFVYQEEFISETVFFRLIQVDFDGQEHRSNVVAISIDQDISSLYHHGKTSVVTLATQSAQLLVLSMQGRVVKDIKLDGQGMHYINLAELASGPYIARLKTKEEVLILKLYCQ